MSILKSFIQKFIMLIQLILVVIFIVFEEIIWEGFARPIYEFIHELHILQKLQTKLLSTNRYIVLLLFVVLLVGVETAGITAGVMAVNGMLVYAVLLYALKIPIAAFTFWLFRATQSKLFTFGWLKYLYSKVMQFFDWIKSTKVYKNTIKISKKLKAKTRKQISIFKRKYFSGDDELKKRFARLYKRVKTALKKDN